MPGREPATVSRPLMRNLRPSLSTFTPSLSQTDRCSLCSESQTINSVGLRYSLWLENAASPEGGTNAPLRCGPAGHRSARVVRSEGRWPARSTVCEACIKRFLHREEILGLNANDTHFVWAHYLPACESRAKLLRQTAPGRCRRQWREGEAMAASIRSGC